MDGASRKCIGTIGIVSNPTKDIAGAGNATCVGIDVIEGTKLMPQVSKLWDFLRASKDLLACARCSPLELSSYYGTVQWFDLINRWLLSCLDQVYAFGRDDEPSVVRDLPAEAL